MRAISNPDIITLPFESWGLVEPFVRGTFRDGMPTNPDQTTFLTAIDKERLAGFVHIETLFHVNSIYVAEEYRNTGLVWELMRETDAIFREQCQGYSACVLTDEPAVARYLKRMGATDRGVWRYLRKDY